MNEVAFVERREPDWKRLHYLALRADVSTSSLSAAELHEFVRLYRRVSADLALVRTRSDNLELAEYLNDLVGTAYSAMYRAPRQPLSKAIGAGLLLAARTVRKLQWFVAASVGVFLFGIALGYVMLTLRPESRSAIVPPMFEQSFEQWKSGSHPNRSVGESLEATAFYSANNPAAAIITGATAATTFGLVTTRQLLTNGLIMGALLCDVESTGRVGHLLVSILPHGVTELSGIVLAGAAGLAMGWALVCPGRRRRGEALATAAKDAIVVLATSVVLMFLAAPIEGFVSFSPTLLPEAKAAFAIASALGWAAFWIGYGRSGDATET